MAEVKNIKISLKVKGCPLDIAIQSLKILGIPYKFFDNYISFTKEHTFIYFKAKIGGTNHVNVTKLKTRADIKASVIILKELFHIKVLGIKIDNIIATYNLNQPVNLTNIIEDKVFHLTKYNPEQFPGLFVKFPEGTVLIFHSGKLVLVGFKSLKTLILILKQVCATIMK